MKRFVIGDIHGRVNALEQCLERSGFDMDNDLLICLGDVCDRGRFVKESFDLLLKIKNLKYILGNHDKWFLEWASKSVEDPFWIFNGGKETVKSYNEGVPDNHLNLLKDAPWYYVLDNRLFVHAGLNPKKPLKKQSENDLMWSRDFVRTALDDREQGVNRRLTSYDEVYLGHTPTTNYDNHEEPILINGVWLMDTGAGWGDKLTIMDVDTKEFWQSDKTGE
jgi:serine/threonine protein phosphatase 1